MLGSKSPTTTVLPLTAIEVPNQSLVARVEGVSSASCGSVTGGVAANRKDERNRKADRHRNPRLIFMVDCPFFAESAYAAKRMGLSAKRGASARVLGDE